MHKARSPPRAQDADALGISAVSYAETPDGIACPSAPYPAALHLTCLSVSLGARAPPVRADLRLASICLDYVWKPLHDGAGTCARPGE
jgi:hypothetical protein